MQRLWIDHVLWTRSYVAAFLAPREDEAVAQQKRMLANAEQIAVKLDKINTEQAKLQLRQHVLIAADMLAAIRVGDRKRITKASTAWDRNADQLAVLFAAVSSRPVAAWRRQMRTHLVLTKRYILARVGKKWDAEVVAFDAALTHAIGVAQALNNGVSS